MYAYVIVIFKNFPVLGRELVGFFGCDDPISVQGKALVGTRQQSSRKFQGFSYLKSHTFD